MNLYQNNLTGTLPSIWSLKNLKYLDLGYNKLIGTIPNEWVDGTTSMSQLDYLYINNNILSGTIPSLFPNIGMGRLQTFIAHTNKLSGSFSFSIPFEHSHFMFAIEIYNNNFTDISSDICNLIVYNGGEMVTLKADCRACTCNYFCNYCIT